MSQYLAPAPLDYLLLILLIGAYIWLVRKPKRTPPPIDRIASYRRWLTRTPLIFGGSALLALAISGQLMALKSLPPEFTPWVETAVSLAGFGGNTLWLQLSVVGGFGFGALVGVAIARWRARRGKGEILVGRIGGLLPRDTREIRWSALMGVTAAVVEELFFRLTLPLFIARVTGDAMIGFACAAVLFAYAHRYQGRAGMALSAIVAVILTLLYLATGMLWFAMLVHALFNLNALVLRPLMARPISSEAATHS